MIAKVYTVLYQLIVYPKSKLHCSSTWLTINYAKFVYLDNIVSINFILYLIDPKFPNPDDNQGGNGGGDDDDDDVCKKSNKKHCDPCKGVSK